MTDHELRTAIFQLHKENVVIETHLCALLNINSNITHEIVDKWDDDMKKLLDITKEKYPKMVTNEKEAMNYEIGHSLRNSSQGKE